jgi:glutamine synthetase
MADTKPDPKAVLEFVKENNVQMLDLRFTDLPGLWHHVSYPIAMLSESSFEEGFGMDGSSIRGWAAIHESDMLLIPDASRYLLDPFTEVPTLVMVCDVIDPVTKQRYDRDPRYIAMKAEMYLASTGLADTAFFGAEAEFFIFDNVRFDQNEHEGYYFIDAEEGRWNSGRVENNLGYRPRYKEGYFPVPPTDHYQDLRTEMTMTMLNAGLVVECHHHEVATGGQTEIDLRFDSLLKSADAMMLYKYIVKNVANQYGKTVTFMPKPLFQDNGSGMHCHQSLWKLGKPLFAGDGYAGLSQMALWYIGGLIKHGPALSALIAPTTSESGLLAPQSLGSLSYSDVLGIAQSEARGVPSAGPELQSISGLLGDVDGRARRHRKQDRSGSATGQGHLRPGSGRVGEGSIHARFAGKCAGLPGARLSVPVEGRCVHRGDAEHVYRVQARERSERHASASSSVRVPDVLRHLGGFA